MNFNNDTITAIATPMGEGGIGIVRISGKDAVKVASLCWKGFNLLKAIPHLQYLGKIHNYGELIDTALAVVMKAPHSYTGEDTVEFSSHGGNLVLKKILETTIKNGARLAEPGEFTKRSFLNGKLDLIQAEAVIDVIHASSEMALKSAQEQLAGKLSNEIIKIHDNLSDLRAEIEATLDFPEEDLNINPDEINPKLQNILNSTNKLASTFENGQIISEGLKVAIIGPPNAGKSSIFNALLGKERAIVHHIAGTTRDIIEGDISYKGIRIRLRDTAGLRDSTDEVEMIGIKWTKKTLEWADICLLVLDNSCNLSQNSLSLVGNFPRSKVILCLNKSDLKSKVNIDYSKTIETKNVIKTSATNETGIEELKKCLSNFFPKSESERISVTNIRHKEALDKTISKLKEAILSIQQNNPPDIIAQILASAQNFLGEITGKVTSADILDKIFSKFCIGK